MSSVYAELSRFTGGILMIVAIVLSVIPSTKVAVVLFQPNPGFFAGV